MRVIDLVPPPIGAAGNRTSAFFYDIAVNWGGQYFFSDSHKMTETQRARGRPRGYDPDAAIDRALDRFWTDGFSGTSLDGLAAATGMKRPSMAAAFGDKKSMYLRALGQFQKRASAGFVGRLAAEGPLDRVFNRYFDSAIDLYAGEPARGCFAVCTATVEAAHDADIRRALDAVLARIDGAIEQRLRRAEMSGELPAGLAPKTTALLLGAVLHSLAVRARAGAAKRQLRQMARAAVRQILSPTGAG